MGNDRLLLGALLLELLNAQRFVKEYETYVNGYGRIVQVLKQNSQKPSFAKFLRTMEFESHHTLSTLLITPVQRVPRYMLLLRDLIKTTPTWHADYEPMKIAYERAEELVAHLDESKKTAD